MRGTELKQTVDGAVRKVRNGAVQAQAKARYAGSRVNEIVQHQSDLAEELSRVVLHHLDGAQGEEETLHLLRQAMGAKNQEYERLGREERVLRDRLDVCQTALERTQEELAQADNERNNLESQAEATMLEHETFSRAKSHRDEIFEQIQQAKKKLGTTREDAQKKIPHYLSDPFFSYLLERGYGEREYQAGALTRALDGWVARLVQFNRYYSDFERLKAIPKKIEAHIQWLEERHESLSLQLEKEHQRILKDQTPEFGKAVERFLAARVSEEALESEVLDLEEKLQSLGKVMARIEQGSDPMTLRAISLIKEVVLESRGKRARKLVEASSTTRDDALLDQIQSLEMDIQRAKEHLSEANREHEQAQHRLSKVEDFRHRFQNAGLGRANRIHPFLRKKDVIQTILAGHGLASLLRKMENQVRVISSSPTYPSTRSSRSTTSSWPSSRSSSGGFGGFGGRTGGGFGGSRGRTGGGF